MEVTKALDIDQLYEKVKDYDLVLTVDAPLADGLNNRLMTTRLGEFAITPRRLVLSKNRNREILEERQIFIKIVQETDLSWKQAFHHLENILDCWKQTGSLEKILQYDRYNTQNLQKIINIIKNTPNIYTEMTNYQPKPDQKIAVIAPYQFNELDKEILPPEYDEIEVFGKDTQKLPKFRIHGTITDILQTIQKNVETVEPDDVAIVVDPDSQYPDLLQSLFRTENIPFMLGTNFDEDEDLRTLLWIIEAGLSSERLKLRDVQPILKSLDIEVSVEHNLQFLNRLDIEGLDEVRDLLSSVEDSTFGQVVEEYENLIGCELDHIRENLAEVDVLDSMVSGESVNRLEYYLDSFDIQVEKPERGVLLASAKSSMFVDRPIIFYLGMDSSWEHDIPEKPWIDQGEIDSKNLQNFELLLQNGEQQYFLVRESEIGDEITPCLYLDEILDREFDSFTDLPHQRYSATEREEEVTGDGFEKEDYGIGVESVDVISQSSLNSLVKCPREYFFEQLVPMEHNEYLERGSLFHDFAEFYINHAEFVQEEGLDSFVDLILEEVRTFVDDYRLPTLETEYRIGLENIVKFLDREEFTDRELEDYTGIDYGNYFAKHFNKPIESHIAEAWFEDKELGAQGKVDLILDEDHLVDHKSGRLASAWSVVRSSNVDLFEDNPNFQPILYLAHHRKNRPNKELYFSFFHFLDNIDDIVSGEADLEDNIVTITYYPQKFEEQIAERETLDMLIEGVSERNDRRKTLEKMGYSQYRKFFQDHSLPHEYDKDELLGSELAQEFIEYGQDKVGPHKYVKNGCESALKNLVYFRKKNYFKEDLDKFIEFLQKQLENLNQYKREGFPIGDVDLDRLDNRDLILGGEYGTE